MSKKTNGTIHKLFEVKLHQIAEKGSADQKKVNESVRILLD